MPLKPRSIVVQPLDSAIKFIALTKGQIAVVDSTDYDQISGFSWQAKWDENTKMFRAERTIRLEDGKRRTLGMHRVVMGDPKGLLIDHKNHNTLDNRRCNLRICNSSQNAMHRKVRSSNKLGLKGVVRNGSGFAAYVSINRKKMHLGTFPTKELAYEAHQAASKKFHGDYSIFQT